MVRVCPAFWKQSSLLGGLPAPLAPAGAGLSLVRCGWRAGFARPGETVTTSHTRGRRMSPENSSGATPWNRLITWVWPSHPARWRDVPRRVRPTLVTIFRLTAAAVAAYVLSQVVTPGTPDLTGPLTALLVVQATAFSTIKMGAVRVGAVLSGILVATLLSTWSRAHLVEPRRGHRRVPAAGQSAAPRRPGPRDPHQRDAHPRRQQPRHCRGDPDRQHPDRCRGRDRLQHRLPTGHADGGGEAGAAPRGRGRGLRPRCRG